MISRTRTIGLGAVICFFLSHAGVAVADTPGDSTSIKRGERVYQRFCAVCHGANLEGQPNWRHRNDDGRLPAPPHDETGHTWHHADDVLFGITKFGVVPPYGPPDYVSDMPAWGEVLSDADIWNVLAYIKSRWPERMRQHQADMTARSRRQSTE